MKAIISESPHEGSIYHCLQSNSKRRTQCFQDMPEEGELDGDYEPLDECLNPLCYSSVCCLLFTNIFGSLRRL